MEELLKGNAGCSHARRSLRCSLLELVAAVVLVHAVFAVDSFDEVAAVDRSVLPAVGCLVFEDGAVGVGNVVGE